MILDRGEGVVEIDNDALGEAVLKDDGTDRVGVQGMERCKKKYVRPKERQEVRSGCTGR